MKYYSLVIIAFLFACGDANQNKEHEGEVNEQAEILTDTVSADTTEVIVEEEFALGEPLLFNSEYFKGIEKKSNDIATKTIKKFLKVYDDNFGDGDFYIEKFLEVDSLKENDEYDSYSWDIGMIQYVKSFVLDTLSLNNKEVIVWGLQESTYEACPYGSWDLIYATIINNKQPEKTILLAEESGGGDPPGFGETKIYASLDSNLNIEITRTNISGEEDNDGNVDADTIVDRKAYSYLNGEFTEIKK